MKKKFLIYCLFITIAANLKAQTAGKSMYVELGGPGLIASVNYDTRFTKTLTGFGGRLGIGVVTDFFSSAVTVPVEVNYLVGKDSGQHFLELGAGTTFIGGSEIVLGSKEPSRFYPFIEHVTVGYRYNSIRSDFVVHAIICPFFSSNGFQFWAGVGFGQKFHGFFRNK